MNKFLKFAAFAAFLTLGLSSCNLKFDSRPAETPPTAEPQPPAQTAIAPSATPADAPTEAVFATPQFAPICEAGAALPTPPAQCREITAVETSVMCAKKKPFNIIFINKGSVYQALTKGFYCTDGGVKDDKQIITCTGNMASVYQVRVCDPSCVFPTAAAPVTQCTEGYQYDSLRGCCAQDFVLLRQNCRVFEFRTSTCKVDCGVYTTKKTCQQNSYACLWIADKKQCVERE